MTLRIVFSFVSWAFARRGEAPSMKLLLCDALLAQGQAIRAPPGTWI